MNFKTKIFGEIVFDQECNKIKKKTHRISDNHDFNNGKIYKISNVVNDMLYIGVTCNTLKTCLSNYDKESKLKCNQRSFEFYRCLMLV